MLNLKAFAVSFPNGGCTSEFKIQSQSIASNEDLSNTNEESHQSHFQVFSFITNFQGMSMRRINVVTFAVLTVGLFWCGFKWLNHKRVLGSVGLLVSDFCLQKRQEEVGSLQRIGCQKTVFEYGMDDPCMVQYVKRWLVGKTFPAQGPQFEGNNGLPLHQGHLKGQFGQALFIDEMLGEHGY